MTTPIPSPSRDNARRPRAWRAARLAGGYATNCGRSPWEKLDVADADSSRIHRISSMHKARLRSHAGNATPKVSTSRSLLSREFNGRSAASAYSVAEIGSSRGGRLSCRPAARRKISCAKPYQLVSPSVVRWNVPDRPSPQPSPGGRRRKDTACPGGTLEMYPTIQIGLVSIS